MSTSPRRAAAMVIDKVTAGSVARARGSTCSGNWPACSRRAASACPAAAAFASQVARRRCVDGRVVRSQRGQRVRGAWLASGGRSRRTVSCARCGILADTEAGEVQGAQQVLRARISRQRVAASRPAASANCLRRSALLAGSSRSGAASIEGTAATRPPLAANGAEHADEQRWPLRRHTAAADVTPSHTWSPHESRLAAGTPTAGCHRH